MQIKEKTEQEYENLLKILVSKINLINTIN